MLTRSTTDRTEQQLLVVVISPPNPEDGSSSEFRNVVFVKAIKTVFRILVMSTVKRVQFPASADNRFTRVMAQCGCNSELETLKKA